MAQQRHEFGMRWDARVPRHAIRRFIGNFHVGAPEEEVAAWMTDRITGAPGFTPALIRQSVKFALECHRRNGGLFMRVMRP